MEFHGRDEISQLFRGKGDVTSAKADCGLPHFHHCGIDYYPNITGSEIPTLFNMGYHYLIFDMGCFGESDFQEFLRCDRKLILGSLAPWKTKSYQDFFAYLGNITNLGEGLYYLVQTGNTKDILQFSKTYHISRRNIFQIPFIKNPFCIEKELFLFLQELLSTH